MTSVFFHQKSANFVISRNRDIDCILTNNFELLKVFVINIVAILIMSAKLATVGVIKINAFCKKIFDVIFMSMMSPT